MKMTKVNPLRQAEWNEEQIGPRDRHKSSSFLLKIATPNWLQEREFATCKLIWLLFTRPFGFHKKKRLKDVF